MNFRQFVSAGIFVASSLVAVGQKVGDAVAPDALAALEWIQGEAPAAWQPGEVYILECWATWCGPCIAAIPHVNHLHQTYGDRGLRVIGVNVWEDGVEKVREFVTARGEGMSYPVAYTGRGGAFETEWLTPAGVRGIPHAFVVKDGTVRLATHPSRLTDEVVEALLEGGEAETRALEGIRDREELRERATAAMVAFREARATRDADAMKEAFDALAAADPEARQLAAMRAELLLTRGQWQEALPWIAETGRSRIQPSAVDSLVRAAEAHGEVARELYVALAAARAEELWDGVHAMERVALSRLQWLAGDPDEARNSAARALEIARDPETASGVPASALERWLAALEAGELPELADFSRWMVEGRE